MANEDGEIHSKSFEIKKEIDNKLKEIKTKMAERKSNQILVTDWDEFYQTNIKKSRSRSPILKKPILKELIPKRSRSRSRSRSPILKKPILKEPILKNLAPKKPILKKSKSPISKPQIKEEKISWPAPISQIKTKMLTNQFNHLAKVGIIQKGIPIHRFSNNDIDHIYALYSVIINCFDFILYKSHNISNLRYTKIRELHINILNMGYEFIKLYIELTYKMNPYNSDS